jgi:hypothetical protein
LRGCRVEDRRGKDAGSLLARGNTSCRDPW